MIKDKGYKLSQIAMFSICVVLFFCAVYKVINVGITWDEVDSYQRYMIGRNLSKEFIRPLSANNHILNSFLGYLNVTMFGIEYNEFIIRMHILFFYILYLVYSIKITKFFKFPFLTFSLLLACYYVHDYFTLARGYAIAVSLVLVGSYYYLDWLKNNRRNSLTISYIFYVIACYGNTMALLSLAPLLLDSFYRLVRKKELVGYIKYAYKLIIPLMFLISYAVYFHFSVTRNDTTISIFSTNEHLFGPLFYEYAKMYFPGREYAAEFLTMTVLTYICVTYILFNKRILSDCPFLCMFSYFIILAYFFKVTLNVVLPTVRLLIPSFPLVVFAFTEMTAMWFNRYSDKSFFKKAFFKYGIMQYITIIVFWFSFISSYNGSVCVDHESSSLIRDKVNLVYLGKSMSDYNEGWKTYIEEYYVVTPTFWFYHDKMLSENGVRVHGFQGFESGGIRWITGNASMVFENRTAEYFSLNGSYPAGWPTNSITVTINDKESVTMEMVPGNVFGLELFFENTLDYIKIDIKTARSFIPRIDGLNDDTREIAAIISSWSLSESKQEI